MLPDLLDFHRYNNSVFDIFKGAFIKYCLPFDCNSETCFQAVLHGSKYKDKVLSLQWHIPRTVSLSSDSLTVKAAAGTPEEVIVWI